MPEVFNKYKNPPPDAVSIMRGTPYGNPFSHMEGTAAMYKCSSREEAVAKFRDWVRMRPALIARARRELRGKNLLCCCRPKECHGDVWLEIVNEENTDMADKANAPLVWWISEADCALIETLNRADKSEWPGYIRDQYESRYGRPGRWRLWCDDQFGDVGIPEACFAKVTVLPAPADYGGIVIRGNDVGFIATLPGFVTDLTMTCPVLEVKEYPIKCSI